MKIVTIAFDCDGTLIRNDTGLQRESINNPVANERIRSLLVALASFKNVKIVVWSGGGEIYARQIAASIGITKYVDEYASKNHVATTKTIPPVHIFEPEIKPDIAIDDIQDCELGMLNLIVREK